MCIWDFRFFRNTECHFQWIYNRNFIVVNEDISRWRQELSPSLVNEKELSYVLANKGRKGSIQ